MAEKKSMILTIILAIILGPITGIAIYLAKQKLSNNGGIVFITDMLSLPGGIISSWFYPQGISSGKLGFAYLAVLINWLLYAVLWFIIMRLVILHIKRKHSFMT